MSYGWEFFWAVVASTAGTSGLVALALWLFKAQIAHWLNKDIERIKSEHQKDLAATNAGYARELESYRTSLISETEALKANQAVKTAMAVRMAEKKFLAFDRLHNAADPQARDILTYLKLLHTFTLEERFVKINLLANLQNEFAAAIRIAAPFIKIEECRQLSEYSVELSSARNDLITKAISGDQFTLEEFETYQNKFMRHQIDSDSLIQKYLEQMLTMINA